MVGSRAASDDDVAFATRLAGQAAAQGATILSGGARGIDEAALLGTLQAGGTADELDPPPSRSPVPPSPG